MDMDEFIASVQTEFAIQNGDREEYVLYTEKEYNMLFLAAVLDVLDNAEEEIDEEELSKRVMKVIRWAERASVDASMVELYLKGLISVVSSDKMEDPMPEIRFKSRDVPIDLEYMADDLSDFRDEQDQ